MSVVIPDSIEPYIGYKALRIGKDGMLSSPQQSEFRWPVGHRAEAVCKGKGGKHYDWVQVPGDPDRPIILHGTELSTITTTTLVNPQLNSFPPNLPLKEGHTWEFRLSDPRAGHQNCSCGIYVVETEEQVSRYLDLDCVLCKIAVWGQVTVANRGARGEFAYPQVMYVPAHLADVAPLVADLYGIPAEPISTIHPALKERVAEINAAAEQKKKLRRMKYEQEKREAKQASIFFGIISIPIWFVAISMLVTTGFFWFVGPAVLAMLACAVALIALVDYRQSLPKS